MARLTRIGIFSFARFHAIFSGLVGLLFGFVFFMLSGTEFAIMQPNPELFVSLPLPVVMVVFLPIIYAVAGFFLGLVSAFLFNIGLSAVGGIQFDMEKGFKED